MQAGDVVFAKAFAEGLRPDPKLTVSQWADRHRFVSQKSSSEAGLWRTQRTPYLREIMDCLSVSSPVTDVVFKKGTQVGGTETGNNWLGYVIHHAPGPMMIVWPTSSAAKRNSKQRLTPLIEESPELTKRVKSARSRDSGNTTLMKEFTGGVVVIAGANSATDLKSTPVRYLFCDEIDEYPADVDDQGDPVELARKRTTNFPRKKRLYVSTPTVEGFSRIDVEWQKSDQRRYFVQCPECHGEQWLKWEQLRWLLRKFSEYHCVSCGAISDGAEVDGDAHECPECGETGQVNDQVLIERDTDELVRVWYECEQCQAELGEYHKTWMLERGHWVVQNPGPDRPAGFHLSALYSPLGWFSWREAVKQYLEALKDAVLMKVFTNTVLGECYEDEGEQPDHTELKERAEQYRRGVVPLGGLLLTASVDVQGNRLEVKVKAFGRDEESWLVDHQVLYGDPDQSDVWSALDEYLFKDFPHAGGGVLRINATAVDSGYMTHAVYDYCRARTRRHVFAIKGVQGQGRTALGRPRPMDINYRGKVVKKGVKLWPLGVDTIKALVYARLKITEAGPRCIHFPIGMPDEYFEQLTAERLITTYPKGFAKQEWHKKPGTRNEALDLEVYAYAAALYAGLTRKNWDKLEQILNVKQADIFNQAAQDDSEQPAPAAINEAPPADEKTDSPQPAKPTKKPRRKKGRGGFVNNWRN